MNKRQRKKAETKFINGGRLTEADKRHLSRIFGGPIRITIPEAAEQFRRGVKLLISTIEGAPEKIAAAMKRLQAERIVYSCGFCGAPLNADKDQVDAPDGYDPNAYPHDACGRCQAEHEGRERMTVTREMALDAGDPSLEGSIW
jgi:hypothetical protein